jgi:DNA-binding XRE family transcriptional regulator
MAELRPPFKTFKREALENPEVKAVYDELAPAYVMKRNMIAMRKAKGFTQEDMANLLGTRKSSISRLESVNSENSPSLATVEEYARVLGYRLKIEFEEREPSP